jgi:hypothetical protein
MNLTATRRRATAELKRALVLVLRPFRKLLGRLLQVTERSEMQELRDRTARLSAASVEAVTFLGEDVRHLDERLARLEEELAAIRGLLEEEDSSRDTEPEPASRSATPSA